MSPIRKHARREDGTTTTINSGGNCSTAHGFEIENGRPICNMCVMPYDRDLKPYNNSWLCDACLNVVTKSK